MKRALLIAGGTVGGLGAVLAITPPQFTSSQTINLASGGIGNPSGNSATTAAPASTPTNTAKTTKPTTKAAVTTSSTPASTQSQGPVPAARQIQSATPTPTAKSVSGTFTGPVVDVSYGNVQVQITVSNGKITDAQALIAPTGRNDRYTSFSVPVLRKQTLAAQSDAIQGASGASYTSYGWYKSLQGALSKAGL
jgi:uncharacterized protein with FMN-binding domain